jgi:hypothetical protein
VTTEAEIMIAEYRMLVHRLIRERDELRAEQRSLHQQLLDVAVELEMLRAEAGR